MNASARTTRSQAADTGSTPKILPTGSLFDTVGVVPDLNRETLRWNTQSMASSSGQYLNEPPKPRSEDVFKLPSAAQRAMSSFQDMINPPARPAMVFSA